MFKRKQKETPTIYEQQLIEQCVKNLLNLWELDLVLDIRIGEHNGLEYREEVLAINDVTDKLIVTFTRPVDGQTLNSLAVAAEGDPSLLVNENTFADREAINERYGFS